MLFSSYTFLFQFLPAVVLAFAAYLWGMSQQELPENAVYWEKLTRFHAETWGVFVAYCNRV